FVVVLLSILLSDSFSLLLLTRRQLISTLFPYTTLFRSALAIYVACYFPVFVLLSRIAVHQFRVPLPVAAPVVWVGLEYIRAYLLDRKSTRLNSSHVKISYAVFCLKKKI